MQRAPSGRLAHSIESVFKSVDDEVRVPFFAWCRVFHSSDVENACDAWPMARSRGNYTPSNDDWRYAVSVIKMVESFAKDVSRIQKVARLLEREGWAAHRHADRRENLSESVAPLSPDLTRTTIVAKVAHLYSEEERDHEPWHVARAYLARLHDAGLEDPGRLRQQAAILLDAAETIDGLLRWYDSRRASIKTRDLTNDTIAAIMNEWKTKPRETAKQLSAHGHGLSEGALKSALTRTRGLGRPRRNEQTLLFYIPGLQRKRPPPE